MSHVAITMHHSFKDVNHTASIYHLNTEEHYCLSTASYNITTHKLRYMNHSFYFLHKSLYSVIGAEKVYSQLTIQMKGLARH